VVVLKQLIAEHRSSQCRCPDSKENDKQKRSQDIVLSHGKMASALSGRKQVSNVIHCYDSI
jgi:hypothetical protein